MRRQRMPIRVVPDPDDVQRQVVELERQLRLLRRQKKLSLEAVKHLAAAREVPVSTVGGPPSPRANETPRRRRERRTKEGVSPGPQPTEVNGDT